jgi:hypothetical protein
VDLTKNPPPAASRAPIAVLRRYARSRRALCEIDLAEYAAGVDWDTPEFAAANRESYEASAALSRWLRPVAVLIDWHLIKELDYWRRTGQE